MNTNNAENMFAKTNTNTICTHDMLFFAYCVRMCSACCWYLFRIVSVFFRILVFSCICVVFSCILQVCMCLICFVFVPYVFVIVSYVFRCCSVCWSVFVPLIFRIFGVCVPYLLRILCIWHVFCMLFCIFSVFVSHV
jgi:hypothetical protein